MNMAFHSFIRTFDFVEGTSVSGMKRKMNFSFAFPSTFRTFAPNFKVYEICKTLGTSLL